MATKNIYIPPDGDPKRLPHFTNVPYADELQEPIYKNLIEVNFFLPEALRAQGRNELLMMYNAKNISFQPFTPTLGTAVQSYKFAGRTYVLTPTKEQTTITDMSINFNLNQNKENQVVIFNTLKTQYDLAQNSIDGTMNYKRDMVGTIIANLHDKRGEVIRRGIFYNVQLTGLDGAFDYGQDDNGIVESMTAHFTADYQDDIQIDDFTS